MKLRKMEGLSMTLLSLCILLVQYQVSNAENSHDYELRRTEMFKVDTEYRTGAQLKLNDQESSVNDRLMQLKDKEIQSGLEGGVYPPRMHFFHAKKYIEQSEIFAFLKAMPKGAVLHAHDTSMGDMDWVIQQTYLPNLYMCYCPTLQFRFAAQKPEGSDWVLVSDIRKTYPGPQTFDDLLYRNLTLVVDDPEVEYPTVTKVWARFQALFDVLGGILCYKPVFEGYYKRALEVYYDDNVQYLEFRGLLPDLYDLEGNTYDADAVMAFYYNATLAFKRSHPDFAGVKFIYSSVRSGNKTEIREGVKQSIGYLQKYPDFFAGYDLVGYEEAGKSLYHFIDDLLIPSQTGSKLQYFFHAGETDWSGTAVDQNLIDAVLLNTSRIGHGYAINKHPEVKRRAKEKGIAVEICPISNQVLKLVEDLRNHPGAELLSEGFPVTISPDDPALWGARGVAYDWYEAFMGLGSGWADLTTLKQLAIDSLKYSTMTEAERRQAEDLWQTQWDKFIARCMFKYKLRPNPHTML